MSQTVAELPVDVLEQIGVKHLFGLISLEAESVGLAPSDFRIQTLRRWRACGGHGFTARQPGELKAAISEAFAVDGPAIVDAVLAADEMPNMPQSNSKIEHSAIAKIKEAVLAVTGG